MSSQRGGQTHNDVFWDPKNHGSGSHQGQHQGARHSSHDYRMDDADNTFGRRTHTTGGHHRSPRDDYLNLAQYPGSQNTVNEHVYDNPTYQFPAGQYQKQRTLSEYYSDGCGRPCVIGTIVVVVILLLGGAAVGLYFGVLRREESRTTTVAPPLASAFDVELLITDIPWDPRFGDTTSPQFISLKADVESDIDTIMQESSLSTEYQSVTAKSFSAGSVRPLCTLRMRSTISIVAMTVRTSIVQSFTNLDKAKLSVMKMMSIAALKVTVTQTTTTTPRTTTTATTTTTPRTTTTTSTPIPTTTTPRTTTTTSTPRPTTTTSRTTTTTSTPRPTTTTSRTTTTTSTPRPTTTTSRTTTTTSTPRPTTTTSRTTTTISTPRPTTTTPRTTTTTSTPRPTTTTSRTTTTTTTPRTTTTSTTPRPTTTTSITTTTSTTPRPTTTTPRTTTTTSTPRPTTTTPPPTTTVSAGPTTPQECRNVTIAIPFLFSCFDMTAFQALQTDNDKCKFLSGVGNCLQGQLESTYNVKCVFSDQLSILNQTGPTITVILGFDLGKCTFTPQECRNATLAVTFANLCLDMTAFQALSTNIDKCSYLTEVGSCLQGYMESNYNVKCAYSDQLAILNEVAVTVILGFDIDVSITSSSA